jgi:hypothetical protein
LQFNFLYIPSKDKKISLSLYIILFQGDDIEIFAPPPKASNDPSDSNGNSTNVSHDINQDLSANANTPIVSDGNTADHIDESYSIHEMHMT